MKKLILTSGVLSIVSLPIWIIFFIGVGFFTAPGLTEYGGYQDIDWQRREIGIWLTISFGAILFVLWVAMLIIGVLILNVEDSITPIFVGIMIVITNLIIPPVITAVVCIATIKKYAY